MVRSVQTFWQEETSILGPTEAGSASCRIATASRYLCSPCSGWDETPGVGGCVVVSRSRAQCIVFGYSPVHSLLFRVPSATIHLRARGCNTDRTNKGEFGVNRPSRPLFHPPVIQAATPTKGRCIYIFRYRTGLSGGF